MGFYFLRFLTLTHLRSNNTHMSIFLHTSTAVPSVLNYTAAVWGQTFSDCLAVMYSAKDVQNIAHTQCANWCQVWVFTTPWFSTSSRSRFLKVTLCTHCGAQSSPPAYNPQVPSFMSGLKISFSPSSLLSTAAMLSRLSLVRESVKRRKAVWQEGQDCSKICRFVGCCMRSP